MSFILRSTSMKSFLRTLSAALIITASLYSIISMAAEGSLEQADSIKIQASQGVAEAQYILGNMYTQGLHVHKNPNKAFEWMKKSANQGYAAAEFDLASMYDVGDGVEKNLEKAAHWYEKAALKGEAAAAFNLANMYETGEGLPKDLIKAYAWFEAASIMGFEDAKTASRHLVQQFDASTLSTADAQAAELINHLRQQNIKKNND